MDDKNTKILQLLSKHGRINNVDLADRVNLSPSACLRRVQELERQGIIEGYRAILNPAAMGRGFLAYVAVGLSEHTKQAQLNFEAAMDKASQVRECHNITGAFEYMLRVETADLISYKQFHTDVLGTVNEVLSINTYVVMGSPKDERA